jgi:hypothetical protein
VGWDFLSARGQTRMWDQLSTGLVCAVCVLLWVMEVSAFAAFNRGVTSVSFTSSFRFPTVPLLDGLRHIHTPEHLENISWPYRGSHNPNKPYFSITSVSPPQRYGDKITVCVRCKVRDYPQTIYMLSSAAEPSACSYMCVQNGCQRAIIHLNATRLGPLYDGHRLTLNCTYLFGSRALDRDMEPVFRFLRFFEKRMRWQGPPQPHEPRANLMWYRRMVLGKEPK